MKAKKVMVGAGAALSMVGIVSLLGMGLASAQSPNSASSALVDKIAERFSLKKEDVQKVFDENKQERRAAMEVKFTNRLDQAVKDGKLTATQKDLIVAKHKEMETWLVGLEDKTPAERKTAVIAKHDEMTKWSKENNIPEGYFRGFGHKHGRGLGRHFPSNEKVGKGQLIELH